MASSGSCGLGPPYWRDLPNSFGPYTTCTVRDQLWVHEIEMVRTQSTRQACFSQIVHQMFRIFAIDDSDYFQPVHDREIRAQAHDLRGSGAGLLVTSKTGCDRGQQHARSHRARQPLGSGSDQSERFLVIAVEVMPLAEPIRVARRVEGIEPHDPLHVLDRFGRPADMRQYQPVATVDKIGIESEGVLELGNTFVEAILKP